MKIKDTLFMSCQTASALAGRLKNKDISLAERIGLRIHLLICDFCGLFFKQSEIIDNSVKVYAEKIDQEQKTYPLGPQRKAQLSEAFKAELKNQEIS